ncbi:sporulation/spore germination protein [Nostoc sp. CCY0012]|uniref:sporulation/spore germination protein n=1 Tax=Nostoc sp. CCY0012 TaxID=1056123 RepID=UPI0039C600F7
MKSKRLLLPLIVVAIAASISSCSSSPTSTSIDSETPAPTTTPSTVPKTPAATSTDPTGKTTNVTLYTSDPQCQELIPQQVSVAAEQPVTSAVGKIIAERDTADFNLSGYRVNVENGVATVDLRLSPQSKRKLVSLSSCEQFALFGSLRKTLTSNAEWKIQEVRFTEQGKEVIL